MGFIKNILIKYNRQRQHVKYGIPFLIFMLGGSFGLKQFSQLRYQFTNTTAITKSEAEKLGIKMKDSKEVTLESEFKKIENLDIDNWENKRGPRPWEE